MVASGSQNLRLGDNDGRMEIMGFGIPLSGLA